MAQATYGQILASHISVFPVDFDQLPKYGAAHAMVYCVCTAIFIKGSYTLRFPSSLKIDIDRLILGD